MTIGDILLQNNKATLDNMLPLCKVQTADDIKRYIAMGYCVGMTANEFSEKYPVLPIENIYASCNMLDPLYYCDFDNKTIPIVLNLQIYGNKRISIKGETDESFQFRILDMVQKISSGDSGYVNNYLL